MSEQKQISDELRYAQGHKHGVQPTPAQWASLLPSLFANVEQAAFAKGAAYPGDDAVMAFAASCKRASSPRPRAWPWVMRAATCQRWTLPR